MRIRENIRTSEHTDVKFKLEKVQLIVSHQKEILEQKKVEITHLKEIISLLKTKYTV